MLRKAGASVTSAARAAHASAMGGVRAYHERVVDHYNNPRNVGSFDKNDPDVGTGLVGARAAEYVKQKLFANFISHPKFISDTKLAIADAYKQTDKEFLNTENSQHRDAGSTASTAVLVGDRLLVANVGDSRAVICRAGKAVALYVS